MGRLTAAKKRLVEAFHFSAFAPRTSASVYFKLGVKGAD
jgi:hypothetical protein